MKQITLTELCTQANIMIEDQDLNNTNFPQVNQSDLKKQVVWKVLMDTENIEYLLESIRNNKRLGGGHANVFDLVSSFADDDRSGKTNLKFIAFGSSYRRGNKEYYPCLILGNNKAVLTLEHNDTLRSGYVIVARGKN